MSSTDIQLYSNNAKSILATGLLATDVALTLQTGTGSLFPAITASNQYFLVTLENAGTIEICKVTAKSGDVLILERGKEGTSASPFPIGTLVQLRVTKGTLEQFARLTDRLGDVASPDQLPSVLSATGNSFLCQSVDDQGNPIVAMKAGDRWRFLTHSIVNTTSTVVSSTTTALTFSGGAALPAVTGRFLVNFTSGLLSGLTRMVTYSAAVGGSVVVQWATPTATAPEVGSSFEILTSNSYFLANLASIQDESLVNAIIFGS